MIPVFRRACDWRQRENKEAMPPLDAVNELSDDDTPAPKAKPKPHAQQKKKPSPKFKEKAVKQRKEEAAKGSSRACLAEPVAPAEEEEEGLVKKRPAMKRPAAHEPDAPKVYKSFYSKTKPVKYGIKRGKSELCTAGSQSLST